MLKREAGRCARDASAMSATHKAARPLMRFLQDWLLLPLEILRGFGLALCPSAGSSAPRIHCLRNTRCSIPSCFCLVLVFSSWRLATPSLATVSEEGSHGLRLLARRPRDCEPACLPYLRPAHAREVLRCRTHDPQRLDSDCDLLRDHRCAGEAARLVYDARLQRRTHFSVAGTAPG